MQILFPLCSYIIYMWKLPYYPRMTGLNFAHLGKKFVYFFWITVLFCFNSYSDLMVHNNNILQKEQGETDSEEEKSGSDSSSEESSNEEEGVKQPKSKGVGGLIECENPNRVVNKPKKVASLNTESSGAASGKMQLSRRER